MGITWVTDVISWIHVTLNGDHDHALWIVPDLINAFHGVFIFIVVGCQPQVSFRTKLTEAIDHACDPNHWSVKNTK